MELSTHKINKLPPSKLIKLLIKNPSTYTALYETNNKPLWQKLFFILNSQTYPHTNLLLTTLTNISKHSHQFFTNINNLNTLLNLLDLQEHHINPIQNFIPKSKSPTKITKELINHTLKIYPIPEFLYKYLYSPTFTNDQTFIATQLLIHITQGISLKNFPLLPNLQHIKKSLHHLHATPPNYNLFEALRHAQLLHLNTPPTTLHYLMSSHLSQPQSEQHDHFWTQLIKFFINNPLLDPSHIPQIIDYINHIKFSPNPPQPNFSLKNRNPLTLLELSNQWHTQSSKLSKYLEWPGLKLPTFTTPLPSNPNKPQYTISELTNSTQLKQESSQLKHCVHSYTHSCHKQSTHIFSLSESLHNTQTKLLTIEINKEPKIIQIKGKYNRNPTKKELSIISQFSNLHNIPIAPWLLTKLT
jgi:hypothetical protein